MPDITIRLTDEMAAFVHAETDAGAYPDVGAFVAALVMNHHEARMARLRELVDRSDAASIEELREATRRRYRDGGA